MTINLKYTIQSYSLAVWILKWHMGVSYPYQAHRCGTDKGRGMEMGKIWVYMWFFIHSFL